MDDSKFEAICDRFEASWKDGKPLTIEGLLDELPENRDGLLGALLEIELEYRVRGSSQPTSEEYETRFPKQRHVVSESFAAMRRRLHPDNARSSADSSKSAALDETQVTTGTDATAAPEHRLRHVGPYRILKPIGRGRFGRVFAAEQTEPVKRRVALKVIETESSSDAILTRFDAERLKLGVIDHPHIASLLDAGETDSGAVYVVMEFVGGIPITRLCDRFSLSVKQRLQLFLQCCEAIQSAHETGIAHGDIRPNNVLVTQQNGVPMVKVVDLGLASILKLSPPWVDSSKSIEITRDFDSLAYASPELLQVTRPNLDVRCDVYSLGVLLYELLTGTVPIGPDELGEGTIDDPLRMIREREKQPPSVRLSRLGGRATTIATQRKTDPAKLIGLFQAGLDSIVMKALDNVPERRYETVREFAVAIESLLAGGREAVTQGTVPPKTGTERDVDAITIAGAVFEVSGGVGPNAVSFETILAPPEEPDELGRLGDFRALRLLGAGGMGFVFLAQHKSSESPIALKVMKPAIELDPNAKRRFLREARAAKDLRHPNLVETHEVGDFNGNPYITMEYLRGQSLGAIVEQGEPIAEDMLIQFAKGISAGLAFAHSRELVHRDIKPSNLWVCAPANTIKILDFGLVRDVSRDHVSLTETGVILGSPKYMSPEQTRGEKVGFESDLFSLGSILYRLATGRDAFEGKNITTTLLAIAKQEPTPIASLRSNLHPGLASLIHSLLQKTPSDRPGSASEVHQTLVRLQSQASKTRN